MDLKIQEKGNGITLTCHVTPRAKRNQIKGVREGVLAVSLIAPPLEGRANRELIRLMASALNIPPSGISLLTGEHSRNKVLFIQGVSKDEAISHLKRHIG
jgi:uncharacterized protein (TIGR00251 family)